MQWFVAETTGVYSLQACVVNAPLLSKAQCAKMRADIERVMIGYGARQ